MPSNRSGHPLPRLTCVSCGATKNARAFPKRGGPSYENLLPTNPRRYDRQCKLCKKPTPANAPPNYIHSEPKQAGMGRPKKKRVRSAVSRQTQKELRARVRIETRVKSMLYSSKKGCHKCGERDPRKLEYDHKDPTTKNSSISRLIINGYSWSSPVLRREIRKCRVLCANCHRVHTIKQQGYYASGTVKSCLRGLAKEFEFRV